MEPLFTISPQLRVKLAINLNLLSSKLRNNHSSEPTSLHLGFLNTLTESKAELKK